MRLKKGYQDMSWLGVTKDEFETFYGNIADKIVQIEMRLIELGIWLVGIIVL